MSSLIYYITLWVDFNDLISLESTSWNRVKKIQLQATRLEIKVKYWNIGQAPHKTSTQAQARANS